MSDPSPTADAPHAGFDRAVFRRFNAVTGGFWRGASARTAWAWTLGLAGFLVLKLLVDVGVNRWNRWFFDALERHDGPDAGRAALAFMGLIFCVAAVGVGIVITRETLQVRWREWCSAQLLDRWIGRQRYLRLTRTPGGVANPEYRISDDVRWATEPLTDFAIGMFTALLAFVTFVGILWSVGGAFSFSAGGAPVVIPAFMVLGALVYGLAMSCLVPVVGRKLSAVTAAKNESEALFRAQTIQLRENAESIALTRADDYARDRLGATYKDLVTNWLRLVRQHGNITWVMNANASLIPVVPLLLAMPKYMQGQLTLGEVVQLASAFAQVQFAIGWLADNYGRVAEWFASARRIVELTDCLDGLDGEEAAMTGGVTVIANSGAALALTGLTLTDRAGHKIIAGATATFAPGEKILVTGATGSGKTVLTRALLGFWPWGAGIVSAPDRTPVTIAHAAPYLPEGALEDAILCPLTPGAVSRAQIGEALSACGAGHLAARLPDHARWMQTLSPGEKQRCAIARLLLTTPDVILIEDALSACDARAQEALTRLLFARCPRSIVVDVSNRPAPATLYDRVFTLERAGDGPSGLEETTRATPVKSEAVE